MHFPSWQVEMSAVQKGLCQKLHFNQQKKKNHSSTSKLNDRDVIEVTNTHLHYILVFLWINNNTCGHGVVGGELEDGAHEPKHSLGSDQRGGHQAGRLCLLPARHVTICHWSHQGRASGWHPSLYGWTDCPQLWWDMYMCTCLLGCVELLILGFSVIKFLQFSARHKHWQGWKIHLQQRCATCGTMRQL